LEHTTVKNDAVTRGDSRAAWRKTFRFFDEKPFFSSFLIAAVCLLLIYAFFSPHYQYSDDIQMLLLFKGVGMVQAPSALNQRENILLCTLVKDLYIHFPRIQWYSLMLVSTQFLSLWAMLAAFQWGSHRRFRTLLFLFAWAGIGAYFFTNLQWTMTSSLAVLGAFFLLAALWREKDRKPPILAWFLVFLLVALGVQIRYPSVGLIALIALPAILALVREGGMTPVRSSILRFLAVAAVASFLSVGFDYYGYHRDPGWAKSIGFFDQLFELHEVRDPVYDPQSKPLFDSIGWTANDLYMFMDWYFLDEDTYSVDKFQKLNDYFPKFGFEKSANDSPAKKLTFDTTQITLFFFLALLWLVPRGSYRALGLTAIWTFLVLAFLLAYEKLPERIFLPALFFLVVLGVFYAVPKWRDPSMDRKKSIWTLGVATVLAVFLSLFTVYFFHEEHARNGRWIQAERMMKTYMDGLHPVDGQLYAVWFWGFPMELQGAFDDFEMYRHFNMVPLTWFQRTPTTRAQMDRFGVKDLFRDMVDNPNILMICNEDDLGFYKIHMREKYGMETVPEAVYQCPFFSVYRVHHAKGLKNLPS
jgi:MFS family permease